MSQEIKNVIIVGGNGNLGPSIIKALDKDSAFNVSILSRKGSKSTYPSHIKVQEVDESWPEDQLVTALKGQDAVVQVVYTDVPRAKVLIDAAIKAGVKRFVPSEFGIDKSDPVVVQKIPFLAAKQEIQDYLLSKEESGLTWSGIITGGFFDWGLKTGFLAFDLKAHTATIYNGGNDPVTHTTLSSIGAATAAVLQNPGKTKNKNVYVNSYRVTQNEILAALEKATGEKWKTTPASAEELQKKGGEKLGQGDYSGLFDLIIGTIYSGEKALDYPTLKGLDNDDLGLPKEEPLEVTIAKIVKGEEV